MSEDAPSRSTLHWCEGRVMHQREGVASHGFAYPVAFVRVPLTTLDEPAARRWGGLFGVNTAGIFSVQRRDHGARDGSALRPWLIAQLANMEADFALGEVVLQTFPRLLGYVFNPVSFWFCHDTAGSLRAVLCEVNNTFGESHNYLVRPAEQGPIGKGEWLHARKIFHVSPFFPVAGDYRFCFLQHAGAVGTHIEYREAGQLRLRAHVGGRLHPVSARRLLRALWHYPFMTLAVMVRIHWHALHLWRKGARFYRKPLPPQERTT